MKMEWRCGSTTVKANELVNIVREAGQAIVVVYESEAKDWAVVNKQDDSPLTKADLAANKIICDRLTALYPAIPIVSEENKLKPYDERKNYTHFFCVDPLDGTKEFIKRNGQFTVNIGLCAHGEPVLGAVGVPAADPPAVYFGVRGVGAFREDVAGGPHEPIRCADFSESDEGLTVVASASHNTPETDAFIAKYKNPKTTSLGSSLKLLLVAEGKAHVYPRLAPTSEWDTCAAHAVVVAAGGEVLQHAGGKDCEDGAPVRYNKPHPLNPFFVVYGRRQGGGGATASVTGPSGVARGSGSRAGIPNALLMGATAAAALAILGLVLSSAFRGAAAMAADSQVHRGFLEARSGGRNALQRGPAGLAQSRRDGDR